MKMPPRSASTWVSSNLPLVATICFCALACQDIVGLEIPLTAEALATDAEIVVVGEVVGQRSTLREDQNGKHIYTTVTLKPLELVNGTSISTNIELEIVGGSFQGWREEVSFSPVFTNAEQSILFLKAKPYRLVGARQGKRTLSEGKFTIDGYRLKPADFALALRKVTAEKATGRSLKSFISELGEAVRDTSVTQTTNLVPSLSFPLPSPKVIPPNGPQDFGGGQLPAAEIPKTNK